MYIIFAILCFSCQTEKEINAHLPEKIIYIDKYIEIAKYAPPREIILSNSQYSINIDSSSIANKVYEAALEIKNSDSYIPSSFSESISEIDDVVLGYIGNNSNLSYDEKNRIRLSYNNNYRKIVDVYFESFSKKLISSPFYQNIETEQIYPTYEVVKSFSESIATGLTSMLNIVLSFSILNANTGVQGTISVLSETGIIQNILSNIIYPISDMLYKAAIIKDHVNGRIKFVNQTREMISELATISDKITVQFEGNYTRKFLYFFKQTAKLIIENRSNVKVGFNLNKNFQIMIDDNLNTVVINLPEPEILSIDSEYSILDIKNKLFIKIRNEDIDETLIKSKYLIRQKAIESGIYEQAKRNCTLIIESMYKPLFTVLPYKYSIQIVFS
jgi:hypothetical protein